MVSFIYIIAFRSKEGFKKYIFLCMNLNLNNLKDGEYI